MNDNRFRFLRLAPLCLAVLCAAALAGCNILGWAADVTAGSHKNKVQVQADYRGLNDHKTAVVVNADEYTLFDHPGAPQSVTRAVTDRLAATVPGIKLVDPKQITEFQHNNPYWNVLSYQELAQRLGVERLVYIDLVDYSTHEPGNQHVWRGTMFANVGAAELDAKDPHTLTYSNTIRAEFPEDQPVGVLESDDKTIELGLTQVFAYKVADLFHDHETVKP